MGAEASPEEIRDLEEWVKADPENRQLFISMRNAWELSEHSALNKTPDLGEEWLKLSSRIRKTETSIPHPASMASHPAFRLLRLAAVILLLLVPAFLLFRYISGSSEVEVIAYQGLTECTLPDGSLITLNKGSVLRYPEHFSDQTRLVELDGEGWFEVTHDASKPFIVSAGNARVEVLGTTFNLNTHGFGNNREVVLVTGKVKVYYDAVPSQAVILAPGEKAVVPPTGARIRKTTNTDPNFLAWKTRRIVFDNTPLNAVAASLTRVYGISIRLGGDDLSSCRITATFDHQELDAVIRVIEATLGVTVSKTGSGYLITGQGCR